MVVRHFKKSMFVVGNYLEIIWTKSISFFIIASKHLPYLQGELTFDKLP